MTAKIAVIFTPSAPPAASANTASSARSPVAHHRTAARVAMATYRASARSTYPALAATSYTTGAVAINAAAVEAQPRLTPISVVQPYTNARRSGRNANVIAPNAASPARALRARPISIAHMPFDSTASG